jgi:transposase InsO family protein
VDGPITWPRISVCRVGGIREIWAIRVRLGIYERVRDLAFNPPAPNVAYVSDITYIRTGAGWLYLAVALDLFSRSFAGHDVRHAHHFISRVRYLCCATLRAPTRQ